MPNETQAPVVAPVTTPVVETPVVTVERNGIKAIVSRDETKSVKGSEPMAYHKIDLMQFTTELDGKMILKDDQLEVFLGTDNMMDFCQAKLNGGAQLAQKDAGTREEKFKAFSDYITNLGSGLRGGQVAIKKMNQAIDIGASMAKCFQLATDPKAPVEVVAELLSKSVDDVNKLGTVERMAALMAQGQAFLAQMVALRK